MREIEPILKRFMLIAESATMAYPLAYLSHKLSFRKFPVSANPSGETPRILAAKFQILDLLQARNVGIDLFQFV
jgi:hypothetical protein